MKDRKRERKGIYMKDTRKVKTSLGRMLCISISYLQPKYTLIYFILFPIISYLIMYSYGKCD